MKKVSVIIPVYNRETTIGRAIDSVLAQTYSDWELILADDGSSDQTVQVVSSYDDPRIHLVRRPQNGGNAAARNTGLDNASGDYIAFLDSDDTYEPQFLEKSLSNPELSGEAGFSWVGTQQVDIDGTTTDKPCWQPKAKYWNNPYHFFHELNIGTGKGIVLRRACIEGGMRFDERLKVAVDTDFFLRLRQQWKYTFVNEHLYTNYLQPGSVRTNTEQKMRSYRLMLDKYSDIIDCSESLTNRWYYKYMWLCLHNKQWKEAKRAMYRLHGRQVKAFALYAGFRLLPHSVAKFLHRAVAQ